MPVCRPDRALSERLLQVNFGKKGASSKLLRDLHSMVNCGIAESNCLRVDMVIDAEAIGGRQVSNNPPGAILLGHRAQPRTVEWGEGGPRKGSCHAASAALFPEVVSDCLWVDRCRRQVGCSCVLVRALIADVEAVR